MKIDSLEKIQINNSEQWVLVRGENISAPLVLQVQAGPGLPMISEANSLNKLLNWEKEYVVAYWDQRGCGKSFNKTLDPKTITLDQMRDDVIEVAEHLRKNYNKKKITLVGYSIGATVSLMAAAKRSSLFDSVILVGIDVDIPTADQRAIEFARKKAIEQNKRNMLKQIDNLSKTPIVTSKLFQERAKILTNLKGISTTNNYNQLLFKTLKNLLSSKHYSWSDVFKTLQGMEFSQNALLPEMGRLNLFEHNLKIDVPVHFVQGVHDAVAPSEVAKRYFENLEAVEKKFTWFEHSAHLPHFDEPEKFRQLLS